MRFKKLGIVPAFLSMALLILSCATPYQKEGLLGGYSEKELAKDIYLVKFRGNGYTDLEMAQFYALRRVGDLGLEKGYKYFTILQTNEGFSELPIVYNYSNIDANAYSYRSYSSIKGTTTSTAFVGIIKKPIIKIVVKYFKNKKEVEAFLTKNSQAKIFKVSDVVNLFKKH